ncbi:MAG: hypothetical protein COV74_01730 [Candidatus Omnitrophica bacterium CG11_big_fil_rev_8_21_14_0_20_45_26]|uniref:histidine kinase n=1 Tax=Candidatus Abzuiibacterium crystallinum TaxID=1974748 RepID=A0A2H0LSD7_9BACT|nr:MAG: hypothetical protein COV74_01730 [Candidatus Omnitrophica bacterium CG11_big_fil_rev_8_21_14_0_20_45_26]PIW65016.1 MAG: hypothetical protein COW12_04010 [Candidatus Omnitrophica bacterium CG12_big_fil_rev_8_21_14_0_65_45_16]
MMTPDFYLKAIKRIDNIDKDKLAEWVSSLCDHQKKTAELLDAIHEGVLVIDSQLQVTYLNLPAQRILGIQSETPQDRTLDHLIFDQNLKQRLKSIIHENNEVFDEPFQLLMPRHQYLRISILCLKRLKGSYVVSLLPETHHDERLKERYQQEHLAAIVTLASGVAHEIGNPLNSINIHLQLIAKQLGLIPARYAKTIKESIEVVSEETDRLDQIVKNFLRATRRKPIQFEKGNLQDILKDVLRLLEPEFKQQHIKLKSIFDHKLEPFLMDEERLNQVFLNIIKNSIQAMPNGGTLRITVKKNQALCRISIEDTGHGMDRKALDKIFDAYYTTKEEGSGLGLVIAYQIIREHHGRIEVQSQLNKGTAFHIYLPIQKEKLPLPSPQPTQKRNEQFI